MKPKQKGTSLAAALIVVVLIISIFSLGFYFSEPAITGKVVKVWKNG